MISIVMPALNEEKGLEKIFKKFPYEKFKKKGIKYEIIVVDGGSDDNTPEIVKANKGILVKCSKGYGRQYKRGFKAAKGDLIFTMDSDASYEINDIFDMYDYFCDMNLDFLSGNRLERMNKDSMRSSHIVANKYLNWWVSVLFGFKIKDSQSGMWLFKRKLLNKIKLESNGMGLSEEIKIEFFKKFKSAEYDINYYARIGKQKLNSLIDGHKVYFYLWYIFFRNLLR